MSADKKTDLKGKSAFELFPDIMKGIPKTGKGEVSLAANSGVVRGRAPAVSRVPPPQPPDIGILLSGEKERVARNADVAVALLLMPEGKERSLVVNVLEGLGYVADCVGSQVEAVDKMGFMNAGVVILQDGFDGKELDQSLFHQYMKSLPMSRRRYIYYVLIGPRFHTLYDLQALAESVNLVVNVHHADKFGLILRKGLMQYEELFGPYVELLQAQGRK